MKSKSAFVFLATLVTVFLFLLTSAAFASGASLAVVNTSENAALYSAPSTDSPIQGYYPFGTKVEIIQQDNEWYHVSGTCFLTGYMPINHLAKIPDQRIAFVGIPEIGYGVVNLKERELSIRYQFPDTASQEMQGDAGIRGNGLDIVAHLGEWCQVRSTTDATLGFVQAEELDIYLRDDLILEGKDIRLERGVYLVGTDMPSGLYTFHVPQDSNGVLTIDGTDSALDQAYAMPHGSFYTIYVPPKATVSILSDGYLTPMENEPLINKGDNREHTFDGRFFIGFETLDHEMSFIISKADDSKPAYYQITNLSNILEYDFETGKTILQSGDSHRVGVPRGCFIEMVNCKVTAAFPAG